MKKLISAVLSATVFFSLLIFSALPSGADWRASSAAADMTVGLGLSGQYASVGCGNSEALLESLINRDSVASLRAIALGRINAITRLRLGVEIFPLQSNAAGIIAGIERDFFDGNLIVHFDILPIVSAGVRLVVARF